MNHISQQMRLNYNDLKAFCSRDSERPAILQPWKWCGEMWATDRRVLIRTHWDGMVFNQPKPDSRGGRKGRTCSYTWNKARDVGSWSAKSIRQFWTWNDHTARRILPDERSICEVCDGTGLMEDDFVDELECDCCDGGTVPNTTGYLLHPDCPPVQGQYLTRLATLLPGAVWETVPGRALGKDHEVAVWRITHGETRAILMPFERAHEDAKLIPLFR